jgi:hypothetical protein
LQRAIVVQKIFFAPTQWCKNIKQRRDLVIDLLRKVSNATISFSTKNNK